ncbi:MAG: ferredoxin [Myxococcota bacterium]
MRIKIDLDLCQGHAVCELEAPEIFRVVSRAGDPARVEVTLEHPSEELRAKLEAAVRGCPNRVISIEPED